MYTDDFPYVPISNIWSDVFESTFAVQRIYVVQTGTRIIQRCIMMTTDPGDLVLDPTCGSGTTAYVAEQWGPALDHDRHFARRTRIGSRSYYGRSLSLLLARGFS